MATNNDELPKEDDTVGAEIAKGEQDEVLEEQPQLKKEIIKKEPPSKPTSKPVKSTVSKVPAKRISPRLEELARPIIYKVFCTLRDKAAILPPALVDNLARIIEAETCLNPEETARVLRRKKRKTKKATKFPPTTKKWPKDIKLDTVQIPPRLDGNMAVCQYLLAVNFVKSILERQYQTPRKDIREIARVILKHLTSVDESTDIQNGDDLPTQQLHLLAEIIACWVAEILVEVAEAHKETLEKYCKKREMKEMEIEDDETDSEEYWEQVEEKYETQMKKEDKVEKIEKEEKIEDIEDETVVREQKDEDETEKKDEEPDEMPEGEKEENETVET